jgi:hypothetical protein
MNRRRDERVFVLNGQSRAVALKDDPRLQAALRGMIRDTVKAYGVAEIDLYVFGLSAETLEGVACDLQLEVDFEGTKAILSPSN